MKNTFLLILIIIAIGCTQDNQIAIGSSSKSGLSSSSQHVSCDVKEEWLNLEYDHGIDYINDIPTDFFLLVYSNSPRFCEYMKSENRLDEVPFQCTSPNEFGWVIHGLWGESKSAYISGQYKKHPRFCRGDLKLLRLDSIIPYLCMSPGTRLLQGEWEKHGSCDFNTAKDYFSKTQELYELFKIPPANLDSRSAVQWMKNNNSELKDKLLHLTNHEFGICFTPDFEVKSCPIKG